MSRIGKMPVVMPSGVSAQLKADHLTVKGPKGSLDLDLRSEVAVKVEDNQVLIEARGGGGTRQARAFHGMTRALINNMVTGVSQGFEKKLDIVGVGWNANAQGKRIVLNIGFCHPVHIDLPAGLEAETPNPTSIIIRGVDKQAVGQLAAKIRMVRPPEPYKGKGIRYSGEYVRRKAGKSFGS